MRSLADLLSRRSPLVMGILNVTPDSFSDGGEYPTPPDAVRHAMTMVHDGADIIDIGGESTRPPGATYGKGADPVSVQQELDRVIPVIERFRRENSTTFISIDTQKSEVADHAIRAGADVINDVSAGTHDPHIFKIASIQGVPLILMHGHGPQFQKQVVDEYKYENVVESVSTYLKERVQAAYSSGVKEILADVGIGFAKKYEDNLKLLKHHEYFLSLGVPLVLGVSRKSTIGRAMGGNPAPKMRLAGSVSAAVYGAQHGA